MISPALRHVDAMRARVGSLHRQGCTRGESAVHRLNYNSLEEAQFSAQGHPFPSLSMSIFATERGGRAVSVTLNEVSIDRKAAKNGTTVALVVQETIGGQMTLRLLDYVPYIGTC